MSSNSTVTPLLSFDKSGENKAHQKIVIVELANDAHRPLPSTHSRTLFSGAASRWLEHRRLVVIQNNTEIAYQFNGTGIAVVGWEHEQHAPIPEHYLPRWSCFVDGHPIDPSSTHGGTDIPADGRKRICQTKSLQPGLHNLTVKVDVSHLPAFFHSIRYIPLPDHGDLNNPFLRINSSDPDIKGSWHFRVHDGSQNPNKESGPSRDMTVEFHGRTLRWFGNAKGVKTLNMTLDGSPITVDVLTRDKHPQPVFSVDAKNQSAQTHTLTFTPPPHARISLSYLVETHGDPTEAPPPSTNSGSAVPKAVLAVSIVGGIVGLLLLALTVGLAIRAIRKRRQHNTWKDSALPSSIMNPGSKISSSPSFSREVVTGDIEYNPEAQKKLDNMHNMQLTEPSAAVILHADSGLRIPLRVSEVPPRYTQI